MICLVVVHSRLIVQPWPITRLSNHGDRHEGKSGFFNLHLIILDCRGSTTIWSALLGYTHLGFKPQGHPQILGSHICHPVLAISVYNFVIIGSRLYTSILYIRNGPIKTTHLKLTSKRVNWLPRKVILKNVLFWKS